jgi:hypothetical protein
MGASEMTKSRGQMNNTKKFIALGLFLLMGLNAYALINSGNDLMEAWQKYEKWDANAQNSILNDPITSLGAGEFRGYVKAIADMGSNQDSCYIPDGVTIRQIYLVIGKYLNEHPEELHLSARSIVHKALVKAFPPKKGER